MELTVDQLIGVYNNFYIVSIHFIIHVYLSNSDWKNSVNCSLVQIDLLDEVMDCRVIVSFKCLRALVIISSPEKTLRLYYDEEAVNSRSKVQLSVLFK